jgi:AcrR family transcriptional regulator
MATAPKALRADAERNRQRLLDAAAELFAERGLDVSLQEIAQHAGVGVATAYRRFPDRDVLIDELFDQRVGLLADAAREGLEIDDPWDGFVHTVERVLEFVSGNLALKQFVMSADGGADRHRRFREAFLPIMHAAVERAQVSGQLRPDLAVTDMPILNMMVTAGMQATQPTAPDHWRRMFEIVLDGLRTRRDGPTALPAPPLGADELPAVVRSVVAPVRRPR